MSHTALRYHWTRHFFILVAIAIVFAIDRTTPAGLAVEILYIPIILYAAWYLDSFWTTGLFLLCTSLTALDLYLQLPALPSDEHWPRILNSISELTVAGLVIWLASLSGRYAKKLDQTCESLQASEEYMRRSESLYRSLIDSLPQCVFRKDLEGRFTFANARFCAAIGRTVDQVVGATDYDHCPVHLATKYRADDRRVVETGAVLEFIEDLQLPDGKINQLQTVKTPVYDADGRIVGIQGIFWDITEKFRAEQALRRSERDYRALAENLPDIVVRLDRQLRHLYITRVVQQYTNQPPEAFLGKNIAEVGSPPHLVSLWTETINRVFQTLEEQTLEFDYPGLQGTRHFESRFVPEFNAAGEVESVLCINRDVTHRLHNQAQAQLHLAELAHATRLSMIGGLVSEIAHEINQPLHAIANFSQAGINVLEKIPIEQRHNLFHWLKQISEQANRAAQIIRNAGRFVRKTPSPRIQVDMNGLVRDSLLLINFDLRVRRVMLRCELADNLPPVRGDLVQIQQVLMNLIRNALDAVSENTDDFRHLLVRTTAVADGVEVAVIDNGPGFNAEYLEHLFDPFFTTKSEGIGLGLSVSQSIVESHNGRLWAQNNPDQGAAFYFTLPAFKEELRDVYCHA
jgi:PAS domain S-box-containing protein